MKRVSAPEGLICALPIPLDRDEREDGDALRALIARIVPHVHAILLLGTTGEFPLLREVVKLRVVELAVAEVAGRVPLYAVCGTAGTATSIDLARRLVDFPLAGIVALAPYYFPVGDDDLERHFSRIADAATLPVALYDIPKHTNNPIPLGVVERLMAHPNIVGLKDSRGDFAHHLRLLDLRRRREGFTVSQGSDRLAAVSLLAGSDGIVSGTSAVAPAHMRAIWDAGRGGSRDAALAAQSRIDPLLAHVDGNAWIAALKIALAEQGIGDGRVASPLPTLDDAARAALRRTLADLGLLPVRAPA
jgi:4-hydroxy-tetrahydrodipicolinate synthase